MEGARIDTVAYSDMTEYERMAIGVDGTLSVMQRTDGEVVYLDEYELRLEDEFETSLADIVDKHLAKEISDDEFEHLVRTHELIEPLKRGMNHGK